MRNLLTLLILLFTIKTNGQPPITLDDKELNEKLHNSQEITNKTLVYWFGGSYHHVNYQPGPSQLEPFTNGNHEWPWKNAGGTYGTVRTSRHKWPAGGTPQIYARQGRPLLFPRQGITSVINGTQLRYGTRDQAPKWKWPEGQTYFEIHYHPTYNKPYEIRVLFKEGDEWGVDRFVLFPEFTDYKEWVNDSRDPIVNHCESHPLVKEHVQSNHRPIAFKATGHVDYLPDSPNVARAYRELTTYKSALGHYWRDECILPSAVGKHSLYPKGYDGWITGNGREDCMKCHKFPGESVDQHDPGRDWYGCWKGGDGIFTDHPVVRYGSSYELRGEQIEP